MASESLVNMGEEPGIIWAVAALDPVPDIHVFGYLMENLLHKFTGNIHPKSIESRIGSADFKLAFMNNGWLSFAEIENAVNQALLKAKADPAFGLQNETWTISQAPAT